MSNARNLANLLNSSGTATLNNGLTLTDGDIAVASGHGVSFASTSDASGMASELLDDYEEGDWTPVLKEGTDTLTTASGTTLGQYNKIGNVVTVFCTIFNITKSGTASLTVEGLPFQSSIFSSSVIYLARFTSNGTGVPIARLEANSSVVQLRYLTSGNSNDTAMLASDIASSTTSDIRFTLSYRTS